MKSKTKKRLVAFMLCMVLVLSSTISAFADELQDTDSQNQIETMADPATEEAIADESMAESLDASQEEQQPVAEQPVEQPVQEEVQTSEETSEQHPDNAVSNTNDSQPEATDQSTTSSEENNTSDETVECEATQLKQKVDNGNHTKTTVVADIPAGAFHAHASEITMEVKRLSKEDVDDAVIVKLIKNALTTNTSLSNYVLYDMVFKVNGVETEPLKAIDVNFKGSGLKVKDTKKATAFYFAPAKSEDGIEEDLLVELPQREDKIKELLDAGTDKTREQIEDEFDFSELSVKDKVADELKMEVRKNQVYGCYVVEDKEENTATENFKTSSDNINLASNDAIVPENNTNETATYADSSNTYTVNFWKNNKNAGKQDNKVSTLTGLTTSTDSDGNTVVEVNLSGKKATSSDSNNYVFYGWSKNKKANFERSEVVYCGDSTAKIKYGTANEQTVFTYDGSNTVTFKTTDFDNNRTLNLYAVYAVNQSIKDRSTCGGNTTVEFFIRYDGVAPYEPSTYGTNLYTNGITVNNALHYYQHIYNNSDAVSANLKNQPTTTQLTNVLNKDSSFTAKYGNYDSDKYYIEWYVIKKESSTYDENGYDTGSWHVDGVIREKSQWTLRYDSNTSDTVDNIIGSKQYQYNSKATVKNTQNSTGIQLDSAPVRTGYTFAGWNTKADGTGTSFTLNDSITVKDTRSYHIFKGSTDTNETATKNASNNGYVVTLYAQWTKNYTPPTPTVTVDKKLSHEKYIKKNDDGTYDLTLNVSGAVRTEEYANKLDVLFVLDTSSSMNDRMSGSDSSTKFRNQDSAVRNAVNTLASKKGVDARFAIVSFDTMAGTNSGWTESKNVNNLVYPSKVANYTGKYIEYDYYWNRYYEETRKSGGTNYKEGLKEANKLLTSARTDATKIVVFLSDGDPTFYTDDSGYVYGNGSTYDSTALDEAKKFLGTMTNMQYFYTVGIGSKDNYEHLEDLRNGVAQGQNIQTGNFYGTNADNLKNAFDTIIRDTTSILCSYVTVTDTLSEYAELANSTVTPDITIKDEDGNIVRFLKKADGSTTTMFSECITANIVTESNKTKVVMQTVGDYKLEAGYTYYVTVKIKPTDAAYAYYQEHGEGPHTGDSDTDEYIGTGKKPTNDTRNNGTSSNQNGFHSNESAQVTYTYDGKTPTEDYKHPVIQVTPEVVNHTVEKKWVSTLTNHSGVTVKLKAYVTEGIEGASTENPVYLTSDKCKLLPTEADSTIELSVKNNWSKTWANLPKYYYYRDSNNVIQKTLIHYSAVEENVPDGYEFSVTDSSDGLTTTITNTEVTADLDIKKVTKNSENEIDGAEFTLYKKEGTTYKKVKDFTVDQSTRTPELAKLASGDYYLEETKAPVGCSLLGEKIYFRQSQGTITLTDKDGNILTTSTMWSLSKENNIITLTIKNEVVYNLPSTGGSGIYLYMIGGVLLMFAAAWILYKNKCREVLKR